MALYVRQDDDTTKQVTSIYKGSVDGPKVITAVYQGLKLLWQYIKSCFGRGYWINDKMWSNRDGWAN
jgi:hypothetical protein